MRGNVDRHVVLSIVFYGLCSSSMLFLNKLSVSMTVGEQTKRLQPGPISCLQLAFAIAFCFLLQLGNLVRYDGITKVVVYYYGLYCVLFVGSVYASMKALQGSNVETQIVFRAATPIAVAGLDYFFLGREMPSRRSMFALLGIIFGALLYVATDSEFRVNGFGAYSWIFLYFFLICIEMTLGKYMMSDHKLKSIWSSVLLTNGLALPMLFLLSFSRGEFDDMGEAMAETSRAQWLVVLSGCVAGTLIGWAGWQCRSLVSATSYTLIGVVNKLLTVVMSVLFLDKHASGTGIFALCLCIAASTQYSQAPMRKKDTEPEASEDASNPLIGDYDHDGAELGKSNSTGSFKSSIGEL